MTQLKDKTQKNSGPNNTSPLTVQQLEDTVVRKITKAPLRTTGSFDFDLPPEVLFPYISDPVKLAEWFPLIKGGGGDHDTSCTIGEWGEGSTRTCLTNGMGTIREEIHYWDEPYACVYAPSSMMMPTKDHLAVIIMLLGAENNQSPFTHNRQF